MESDQGVVGRELVQVMIWGMYYYLSLALKGESCVQAYRRASLLGTLR